MLAVFLLSLGVAIASPAVKPQTLEMVCAGGTYKLVPQEGVAVAPSALDCPLCAPSGLPPALPLIEASPDWGSQVQPLGAPATRIASQTAWPPPARAPPANAVG